jgi:DNA-directed RNA polymerase II subunit RPB7
MVMKVSETSKGRLHESEGDAYFDVVYSSLVFKPLRNEVLPAQVVSINQNGFFAQAGPLEIFVSTKLMPEDFRYEQPPEGLATFVMESDDQVGSDVEMMFYYNCCVAHEQFGKRAVLLAATNHACR